ncbi:MAG: hypothetical protein A2788_00840 [Candidatus Abawacabacteria bacterium RIFCSPHIGHO2_01_FULL_46_8]|uniref:Uncharacterized protein n=1 Tax=Candidatus Abawacabacteria bacterium RIFCSPHIGHO2_01_FULL_46_8 TaxID=1817815 RepID=A0A1F4XHC9_9BACT|nr:MAG: hypothetical protein A2788_00840 [Candidatus Abawacabacteria bacterium RIFCSPHIGHO2_01_FULL_46_8]
MSTITGQQVFNDIQAAEAAAQNKIEQQQKKLGQKEHELVNELEQEITQAEARQRAEAEVKLEAMRKKTRANLAEELTAIEAETEALQQQARANFTAAKQILRQELVSLLEETV